MAIRRVRAQARALTLAAASLFFAAGVVAAQPAPSADQPASGHRRAGQGQAHEQWPKRMPLGDGTLVVNAPRADSLAEGKLSARSAARIERDGEGEPLLGTIWLDADVDVDRADRTVALAAVRVSKVEFPRMPPARQNRIAQRVGQWLTRVRPRLPLDDVLAQALFGHRRDEAAPNLNTEPPKILFETEPAILVVFDGEPRFRAVDGSKLERALNTPFLVLHDSAAGVYWLNGGASWFRAQDPKGPWSKDGNVPSAALQVASRDLKEGGVADSDVQQARQSADQRVPKILVATEPTELVVSDGAPQWKSLEGGGSDGLETLGNSESGVFRTTDDRQIYVVLSGRWYRAGSFEGPWTYVRSDRLPESFRRIPADSASGDVLAFVPGTAAAQDAVEDAVKPRTAAVKRSEAHVDVTYDGDPRFEPVPSTHVEYALNTPEQVLKIRGRYYVVDNGVWFTAGSPNGPWTVADAIPDEEIQAIPPQSPVYNTRFVSVYDATPELVYTAYTPAYLGSYPYDGGVVFGTGWYYRPWWGSFYYPRPWTWGFHARYAAWAGWGYGFGWGPAWGGFRYAMGYGWGARWMGPGGFYRPAFRNVNITRNVTVNRTVAQRNLYSSGVNRTRAAESRASAAKTSRGGQKQMANRTARTPGSGKPGGVNRPGGAGAKPKAARPSRGAGGRHGGGGKRH